MILPELVRVGVDWVDTEGAGLLFAGAVEGEEG